MLFVAVCFNLMNIGEFVVVNTGGNSHSMLKSCSTNVRQEEVVNCGMQMRGFRRGGVTCDVVEEKQRQRASMSISGTHWKYQCCAFQRVPLVV